MASLQKFDAEKAENLEDIEKQFSVKAVQQLLVYWKLLRSVKGSKLRLTKYDNDIYEDFIKTFPEYSTKEALAQDLVEDDLKSAKNKARWRDFTKRWEDKIDDYNFGTMLRVNAAKEYEEDSTIFSFRLQFYCFEIARNKNGLNDWVYGTTD